MGKKSHKKKQTEEDLAFVLFHALGVCVVVSRLDPVVGNAASPEKHGVLRSRRDRVCGLSRRRFDAFGTRVGPPAIRVERQHWTRGGGVTPFKLIVVSRSV
jgi:hypothetical protein